MVWKQKSFNRYVKVLQWTNQKEITFELSLNFNNAFLKHCVRGAEDFSFLSDCKTMQQEGKAPLKF